MVRQTPPNKNRDYFKELCRIIYFTGGQDYWPGDLHLPKAIKLLHLLCTNLVTLLIISLVILQLAVFFTDQKLTDKQIFDSKIFAVVHPVSFWSVVVTEYRRKEIGDLMKKLVIQLKEIYNDVEIESNMIAACKVNMKYFSVLLFMTCVLYGVEGCLQVMKGDTFVTMVTAWPNVEDISLQASVGRVAVFVVWIFVILRMITIFFTVIPLTICLSHQFVNLKSYFERMNGIFDDNSSQEEKEAKFIKSFKVGIYLHSETLKCVDQLQTLFNAVYGGQIVVKSLGIMTLMASMANAERSFSHIATTVVTVAYALLSLGCVVLNAGNTTVEAARLPSAIASSGWQHCTGKNNTRVRHLMVFALLMSQRPVELKCLGFVTLSFETYVTIVKSCYSAFSVLY